MVLLALSDGNTVSPPAWVSTPNVVFTEGEAGTYDLTQHVSKSGVVYSLAAGSSGLPTGVTLASNGTLTASTGTSEGTTTGVIVAADAVNSPSFSIDITSTGEPTATIIVRADGGGDHTTVQAALNAASAGDIIEIQANTVGGTRYFNENLTLASSGTLANVITVRARSGDTIVLYCVGGNIVTANDKNYYYWQRLQFGRDETLNGWEYTTTDPTKGRFGVEHGYCVEAKSASTAHHHVFKDCRFYGGQYYDAVLAEQTTEYWGFLDCTVSHCGVNVESSTPDFGSNGIHLRGKHCFMQGNLAELVGHNGLQMEGEWSVFLDNICDGDWSTYNTGTGNRTMAVVGDKGPSPYGPILSEGNVCRGAKPEAGSGDPSPATKFHSYRGITRRNYIFDNEDQAIQWAPQSSLGIAAMDYNRFFFNTFYNCGWLQSSTDAGLGAAWNARGIETVWKNNIIDSMGAGRSGDDTHFRWVRNNSTDGAYSNGWRGLVFTENTLNTSTAGNEKVRLIGTGASQETGVTAIEAQWAEFTNNNSGSTDFQAIGSRTSDNYATIIASFEIDGLLNPPGFADAVELTQANGAGSLSSTLYVDDSLYFAALNDTNTWNLSWFAQFGFSVRDDYIQIGGSVPGTGGSIAQISAVDYDNHKITLDTQETWSNNDKIFLVDHDGATALSDYGGNP